MPITVYISPGQLLCYIFMHCTPVLSLLCICAPNTKSSSNIGIHNFIGGTVEFYGNSLTQTNQTKQTKEKFIRLYYLDCWIDIIQCDEQNKSSTKCIVVQIIQFDELLFCLFFFHLSGLVNFHETQVCMCRICPLNHLCRKFVNLGMVQC